MVGGDSQYRWAHRYKANAKLNPAWDSMTDVQNLLLYGWGSDSSRLCELRKSHNIICSHHTVATVFVNNLKYAMGSKANAYGWNITGWIWKRLRTTVRLKRSITQLPWRPKTFTNRISIVTTSHPPHDRPVDIPRTDPHVWRRERAQIWASQSDCAWCWCRGPCGCTWRCRKHAWHLKRHEE